MFDLNSMTAKERLEKIYENERSVKYINYDLSSLHKQLDDIKAEIHKLEEKRDNIALEFRATKETIEVMPTIKYREMLQRHYIDGQTWEAVAEAIGYSTIQIYNYRSLALEEFEKTWESKKT